MLVWISLIGYLFLVKLLVGSLRTKEKQKQFLIWAGIGIVLVMGLRGHEYVEVYDVWVYYTFCESMAQVPWLNIFDASGFEPGYVLFNKILITLIPWPQIILFAEAAFCVFATFRFIYLNSEYSFESVYFFVTLETMGFYLTAFRQAFAISICLLSVELIKKRKLRLFCLAMLFAVSFHKTAIVFVPAYFFVHYRLSVRQKVLMITTVVLIGWNSERLFFYGRELLGLGYGTEYIGSKYGGIVPIIIYLIIIVYSFVFFKRINNSIGVNMTIMGFGIYVCRYSIQILQRISFYYTPGAFVALPEIINHIREPRLRFALRYLAIVLAFVLFMRRVAYAEYGDYQFFWQ